MVAANKGFDRKAFAEQFEAWSRFASDKPGKRLYVHADLLSVENNSESAESGERGGIGDRVIFPDRYSLLMGMYPPGIWRYCTTLQTLLIACSKTEGLVYH